jgi:hypothetical protein
MTTVYVHIGTGKTGSTSLQNFLFENRETLLNQGILYPLSGINYRSISSSSQRSHNNLYQALNKVPADPKAGDWETFHTEVNSLKSKLHKVIISAEMFSYLDHNLISLLRDYLSEYETKIIVYLRRQDQYLESMYWQKIKMGCLANDLRNSVQERKWFGRFWKVDYYQLLKSWEELFSKQNIVVRVFEKEQLREGSLYDDFLFNIDPDLVMNKEELKYIQTKNVTPNLKVLKAMHLFNKLISLGSGKGQKRIRRRRKLLELYERTVLRPDNPIANIISKLPDFLISPEVLTIEERINLMKEFEESNQKVAREYLGRQDGRLFYSTPES